MRPDVKNVPKPAKFITIYKAPDITDSLNNDVWLDSYTILFRYGWNA